MMDERLRYVDPFSQMARGPANDKSTYRRHTNFIHIPTTVIGPIDASVSIKVAVNCGNYKNRLGVYHVPQHLPGVRCLAYPV